MVRIVWGLLALALFSAAPALAAPCKTRGAVDVPIAFPKNDRGDITFGRSMVPVIMPYVSDTLPRVLTCIRSTESTALGDYVIGGENGEAFPRIALRADGQPGPVVYVAAPPEAPGKLALVVYRPGSQTVLKRFYDGIPTDRLLAGDIRAALASDAGLISYDIKTKAVGYSFVPPDTVPPPVVSGTRADGTTIIAGPQFLISSSGDPALLDIANGTRHTPSGFACPETFDGLPVLLMSIDPRPDYLSCDYRAGTDLGYRADDPIRYSLTLIKAPGETARSVFDRLTADARASLRITGDRKPPLGTGPAPAPALVAYWNTENAGVQGVWVGSAGGWIVWLRAQYPPSVANDREAGEIARILFAAVGKQVK